MKKILTFTAALAAASMAAFAAHADPVDFVDYADNGPLGEHGIDSGDSVTINTVGMTINSNAGFSPYFDATAGGPGGLGVCRVLTGPLGTCDPSDDDSIDGNGGIDEWVEIFFDAPYTILGLSFTDGNHNDLNSDNVGRLGLWIDGFFLGTGTFVDAIAFFALGQTVLSSVRFDYVDTEFYVNGISDVPIPGAIPLMLSGLAGLGFASRRRKTA